MRGAIVALAVLTAACEREPLPPQLPKCSALAADFCAARGWTLLDVPAFAGAGRVYCAAPSVAGCINGCDACDVSMTLVWEAGAASHYCPEVTYSTKAGRMYGGHSPCECGDNLLDCGAWPMSACDPTDDN